MPVIPISKKLRQKVCLEFETSMRYTENLTPDRIHAKTLSQRGGE